MPVFRTGKAPDVRGFPAIRDSGAGSDVRIA
jgi:hypothetical protein